LSEQKRFDFGISSREHGPAAANYVVEAGAGTGKTTRIVRDVVSLLLADPQLLPERIVLITFTEKAAGEIAERIRAALTELRIVFDRGDDPVSWPIGSTAPILSFGGEQRRRAAEACAIQLGRIGRLRSQTIHSFCQSILRLHPVEAGLDPQFRLVEGFERSRLIADVFDRWMEEETRRGSSETLEEWEAVRVVFNRLDSLRAAIMTLVSRREVVENDTLTTGTVSEIAAELRDAVATLRALSGEWLESREGAEATLVRYLTVAEPPAGDDLEKWVGWLEPVGEVLGEVNLTKFPKAQKDAAKKLRGAGKEKHLLDQLLRHRAALALRAMARRFLEALDREKKRQAAVDFDDLLHYTAALLADDSLAASVRKRYDAIFVDEFQDTDRMQAFIIERLARDGEGRLIPGRTTLVGDPKQSIYSFRRADPETFAAVIGRFVTEGAEADYLDRQFRSDPDLVVALNALFGQLFHPERTAASPVARPSYKPLQAGVSRPRGRFSDDPVRVRFLGTELDDSAAAERLEAELVAEWISSRTGNDPARLNDYAILSRKMTHASVWADVFARRGIPLLLPPGRALLDRPEAVDLLAVLQAIVFPFDRGALIGAARSRYFALSDDEIVAAHLLPADLPRERWKWLESEIHRYGRLAGEMTISRLIETIVRESEIDLAYRLIKGGDRSMGTVERLITIAREYEQRVGGSLRQFVADLAARRLENSESETGMIDESEAGVRMMTIHASKGLEFGVVVLVDIGGRTASDVQGVYAVEEPPSLVLRGTATSLSTDWRSYRGISLREIVKARDEAELERLFYVAVTRARQEIVFVTPVAPKQLSGLWAPIKTIFAFEKAAELTSCFPDAPGEWLQSMPIGEGTLPVRFERVSTPAPSIRAGERLVSAAAPLVAAEPEPEVPHAASAPRLDAASIARRRASGRRRDAGIALHRALELWSGIPDQLRAAGEQAGRETSLDSDTTADVVRRLQRLKESPAMRMIRESEILGREVPIFFHNSDGRPSEGRIDLLVRKEGRLCVVDYKRGQADAQRLARDSAQVRGYCDAVAAMTGEPVDGALWYIDGDGDVWSPVDAGHA
jgi:ATP-dependent helicase/nuclease subunit A